MPRLIPRLAVAFASLSLALAAYAADLPAWAYPVVAPGTRGAPDDGKPKRVPDSTVELTRAQITGRGAPVADWHPGDHPPMPDIVGKPRTNPYLLSCGYCHLPNGAGRPEKRVTARSKLPQKRCTGLDLPRKPVRNRLKTRSVCRRIRQNRCA